MRFDALTRRPARGELVLLLHWVSADGDVLARRADLAGRRGISRRRAESARLLRGRTSGECRGRIASSELCEDVLAIAAAAPKGPVSRRSDTTGVGPVAWRSRASIRTAWRHSLPSQRPVFKTRATKGPKNHARALRQRTAEETPSKQRLNRLAYPPFRPILRMPTHPRIKAGVGRCRLGGRSTAPPAKTFALLNLRREAGESKVVWRDSATSRGASHTQTTARGAAPPPVAHRSPQTEIRADSGHPG